MKSCPQCKLRYPDESTHCFVDGTELVAARDPRIGTVLAGRYLIERPLAEGGMASVYIANHRLVDRPCAIKILSRALARNQVVRERFRREAKAAQQLAHPNIIDIFDQGETDDGLPFMVMELLDGETLSGPLARGPMPMERALPILAQIARALARAHDFGVVHRDLKPDNVFLCRDPMDLVKLLDFGIARSASDSRLTSAGEVFGTPQYIAPERINSIDVTPSADLYALGVIGFQMLAGRLPYVAHDVGSWFLQHLTSPVPSLASFGVTVPPALDALLRALMAKSPNERPVDAHRVHADLLEIGANARIAMPADLDRTVPDSWEPPRTLPPTAVDRWASRIVTFEDMLASAYGSNPPAASRALLDSLTQRVEQVRRLRSYEAAAQNRLELVEARERDGRQRFGFAMDALGVDASRARNDARLAQAEALDAAGRSCTHRDALRRWQAELRTLELSDASSVELVAAYRAAADEAESWRVARLAEVESAARVEESSRVVADLEFQIHELRSGLERLEQASERERTQLEAELVSLGRSAEELQSELVQAASDFCTPLRSFPALATSFSTLGDD